MGAQDQPPRYRFPSPGVARWLPPGSPEAYSHSDRSGRGRRGGIKAAVVAVASPTGGVTWPRISGTAPPSCRRPSSRRSPQSGQSRRNGRPTCRPSCELAMRTRLSGPLGDSRQVGDLGAVSGRRGSWFGRGVFAVGLIAPNGSPSPRHRPVDVAWLHGPGLRVQTGEGAAPCTSILDAMRAHA